VAAPDVSRLIFIIDIGDWFPLGFRKAVLCYFSDHFRFDLTPSLTDVFILKNTIHIHLLTKGLQVDGVVFLIAFPDEAGILADHNSIAGIDIFYHADNVDPLAVVSFIVTSKNAFD
jgi:hypothetical protein